MTGDDRCANYVSYIFLNHWKEITRTEPLMLGLEKCEKFIPFRSRLDTSKLYCNKSQGKYPFLYGSVMVHGSLELFPLISIHISSTEVPQAAEFKDLGFLSYMANFTSNLSVTRIYSKGTSKILHKYFLKFSEIFRSISRNFLK